MGYTTEFDGKFTVTPPLSAAEAAFLKLYADTRHCECQESPHAADGRYGCPPSVELAPPAHRSHLPARIDDLRRVFKSCTRETPGAPEMWCQWVPSLVSDADGSFNAIEWDGGEKFYSADRWLAFLIREFLMPRATAMSLETAEARAWQAAANPGGHVLNGRVKAQGEDADDRWELVVRDNCVMRRDGATVFDGGFNPVQ